MRVDDVGLGFVGTLTAAGPGHTGHAVGNAERSEGGVHNVAELSQLPATMSRGLGAGLGVQ